MAPKVAIVYLTYYDARHYIDEAVLSVERLDYPKQDLAFVVVDNSEHGPSAEYVKETVVPKSEKTLPKIVLMENEKNVGFATGNNQGIAWALDHWFDYVYLLNNDAKLHPDAIKEAVRVAESDKTIGAVQSLLLLWKTPDLVNSSGNDLHYLGFGLTRDYKRPVTATGWRWESPPPPGGGGADIGFASGAGVLYGAKALRHVGNLEEFYWMYHEDVELSWRMRLSGYRIVLAPKSIAYHDYEFRRSTQKMFWIERNRLVTHLTHLKTGTLLLFLPALLWMELLVLFGSIKEGWWIEKVRADLALFSKPVRTHILIKRRMIREQRTVPDREIIKHFVGRIEHQEIDHVLVRLVVNPVLNAYWKIVRNLVQW